MGDGMGERISDAIEIGASQIVGERRLFHYSMLPPFPLFDFFSRQQLLNQFPVGGLNLLPSAQHRQMFIVEDPKLAGAAFPWPQIRCRENERHWLSLQERMTARQLVQHAEPPHDVAKIQAGQWTIQKQYF